MQGTWNCCTFQTTTPTLKKNPGGSKWLKNAEVLREAKCLKTFSDVHEHILNAVSPPYQKRLLLTGQDGIKNFLPSKSTTFHTHTSSCFSQPHFTQLQTQNQNRNILLSLLSPRSLPPPNVASVILIPPPSAQVTQTRASKSTPHTQPTEEDALSHHPISHPTSPAMVSFEPGNTNVDTGWISALLQDWSDMQLKISQLGLGAFALDNFILRNLLYWWRNSFMVIIIRETFLPAMSHRCATDTDPVIWNMGQQAGFAQFLDAVCTFSCYKIMFIRWGFATHHVAFCSIFDFL